MKSNTRIVLEKLEACAERVAARRDYWYRRLDDSNMGTRAARRAENRAKAYTLSYDRLELIIKGIYRYLAKAEA